MFAKFIITTCIFLTIGISAQSKAAATGHASVTTVDPGDSLREKALQDSIKAFETSITAKLSEIERLQTKVVSYDGRLQKTITIVNENTLSTFEERQNYSIVRYLEYEFESANKLKEVRTLKTIDSNLLGSIYKIDGYLQNAGHEKDKKSTKELEGF